jgi:hypothetical protein
LFSDGNAMELKEPSFKPPRKLQVEEVVSKTNFHGNEPVNFNNAERVPITKAPNPNDLPSLY